VSDADQRSSLLQAEVGRLEAELAVLDRQWATKHRLGLVALVALPLMIARVEALWIAIAILAAPCLVATQAYLLYMRRTECRELIEQAERDLARVSMPNRSSPSSSRARRA
jgi:hypothetical protein